MTTTTTAPDGDQYVGFLDISAWQFAYDGSGKLKPGAKSPDWQRATLLGVAGIIHRIGNGTTVDPSFDLGYQAWRDLGDPDVIKYGAYYYAQPNKTDGSYAAMWFSDQLDKYPELNLKPMLDLEAYYGPTLSPIAMCNWLVNFFEVMEMRGHPATIYWGHAFANPHTISGSFADRFSVQPRYNRPGVVPPLNVSEWAGFPRWDRQPIANTVIGEWDAWQFSSDGNAQAYGCPPDGGTRIDCNLVLASRWAEMQVPPAPTPPPSEEDVTTFLIQDQLLGGAVYFADTLAPVGDELFAAIKDRPDVVFVPQTHEETSHAFLAKLPPEAVRLYDDFAERPKP